MSDRAGEAIPERLAAPLPGEAHTWWATIDADAATLERAAASVDAGTLARAAAMRRDADRRRTLLAHALLRRVLAAVTGTSAARLVLDRRCASCGATDHGRPYLHGGPSFGISHGGDVVAVAIAAPDASIAVDVEPVQPAERWESVRRHAFDDDEWAATAGSPDRARTALWTRKEALVKATGHGLSLDLTRVHLGSAAGGTMSVRIDDGVPKAPEGPWVVADVELAADHCAAVALRFGGTLTAQPARRAAL